MSPEHHAAGRPESCLYAALDAAPECHDRLLLELIWPMARELRDRDELDSLFFVRYADPTWQLRFRVLGRPEWVASSVRPKLDGALRPFLESGAIQRVEFGEYAREWERYGGPEGMALAERIFLHDSLACLALLEAESTGASAKSRREYSLVFTERFLDLFGFDARRRLQFYREGHEWAFRDGAFRENDRERLDRQYVKVRAGLLELIANGRAAEPESAFGGQAPARVAMSCLDAARPVVAELLTAHSAGRILQDLVYLAWSYAHLHANRLGIDLVPEAILRYLMFRAYEEAGSG